MNGKRRDWVRHFPYYGYPYKRQSMLVQQLVGRRTASKSMDVCIVVPRGKPAIEQVIRAYVNRIRITSVEVVMNEVLVCGHFDVKVMYVGCLPSQSVHAVETRRMRFAVGVYVPGACYGMAATAQVRPDYVDADCEGWRDEYYEDYGWSSGNRYLPYEYSGWPRHSCCTRRCHVSVSLGVTASVFADRPLLPQPSMPYYPKG